jgi:predicted Zn-dependent peptidase
MVNFEKSLLENGITVVTESIEGVRSFSLGFWVVVGSRNERAHEKGIAHFIEHTLFKGTKRRSIRQIARALESKGATLDAFTSKEVTCVYSRGLSTHLKIAIDVIADLVSAPLFPARELEKERRVVTEEIKDTRDSPEKHIFDLFFSRAFAKHPLGTSVLGRKEDVAGFTREKVCAFYEKWYKPERVLVTASGFLSHKQVCSFVAQHLKKNAKPVTSFFSPRKVIYEPFSHCCKRSGLFQSHCIIATPAFAYDDARKYPLLVLDVILGDGMSSILFQKVREEKALVYEIASFVDFFSDTGVFGVYLACDPMKIEEARDTVLGEFKKIAKKGLPKRSINEAKARLKAKVIIGMESTSNRMFRLGRGEIYRRRVASIDELIGEIDRVTREDVHEVAERVLTDDGFSFVYIGDIEKGAIG